jgi:hypothetical protein
MQSAARAFETKIKPDQRSDDLDNSVWRVQHLLVQVAQREFTAWALSSAMEIVARRCRAKVGRISAAQRDELLSAVVRAQLSAIEHLPPSYRREQIAAGMQALAGQVMLWAESREQPSQRSRHALADLDAYARMFRNDLHNISLREEIEHRAWERRNARIQDLLRPDDGREAVGA